MVVTVEKQRQLAAGPPAPRRSQQLVTAVLILGPPMAVIGVLVGVTGLHVTWLDLVLALSFFVVTGHGLSAGFHRMFTHRSFKSRRGFKIAFALAGSLAVEGSVTSWVANHRQHHAYTDKKGDPHTPYEYDGGLWTQIRGVLHAHVGWLFRSGECDEARWAPDLVKDRDLVVISRLFPLLTLVSLGAPMLIGYLVTGTWAGALGGLVWGGLIRIFALHQATFSVNSACHIWGTRPFATREGDRSTNFAPLAVLAMGDNWHNLHHACPTLARHGVDRHQLDSTARLIWILERTGMAWDVKWPEAAALDRRRQGAEQELADAA